ncbi:MAG: TonB-dependent receptor, partial [Segetibacter sp.]|nr:TonB-dependent receptor [Segetibacter sp.]
MKKCLLRVFHVQNVPPLFCLLFFALLLPALSMAQSTRTVSGNVVDNKKAPLQGVSVTVKGTTRGTTTDADGHFVLPNVPERATLVISSTGFTAQEIGIGGRNTFNVTLAEAVNALNDVVVIGYGTRQRRDVTGAVSQVKATQLENENPQSVQDLLRGNVPGLSVTSSPNAKGGGNLLVRGKSSINAGTSPLIVLDGVIYPGDLSDINPNDIATVDVLKDASSAAVYGAKAASGVILVTTKKGSGTKPTITFNSNTGLATLAMDEPLYDGPGFVKWRTDVLKSTNISNAKPFQFDDPRNLPSNITVEDWKKYDNSLGDPVDIWLTRLKLLPVERENYKIGKTTNWYDMMFGTGLRNDHTISLSGKKEDVSFYMSANYTRNEGYIVGDK